MKRFIAITWLFALVIGLLGIFGIFLCSTGLEGLEAIGILLGFFIGILITVWALDTVSGSVGFDD